MRGHALEYGSFVVYNLEVAGSHNYFVGSEGAVLVHNACKKAAERALKQNKDFRRWFHREYKGDQVISSGDRHNPDLDAEQVLEAFEEWLSLGSPRVK